MKSHNLSIYRFKKIVFLFLLGLMSFNLSFALAQKKTTIYYVSPNGSDANAGTTLELPLVSISKANQLVKPGGKVLVRGGTYKITETIIITVNYTNARGMTICYFKPLKYNILCSGRK